MLAKHLSLIFLLSQLYLINSTQLLHEQFHDGESGLERWISPRPDDWKISYGKWALDITNDVGLRTSAFNNQYAISSRLAKPFSSLEKSFILQFSARHSETIDCKETIMKIYPSSLNQKTLSSETPYNIAFGPKFCGDESHFVVTFSYNGHNYSINKEIPYHVDQLTHVYTLVINGKEQSYAIVVDNKIVHAGLIADDFDMLPPRTIPDPNVKKPETWDDTQYILDPLDEKPATWVDVSREILNEAAKKPEEWDDELDGEWERPTILNPEYQGEWSPKWILNPNYQGKWEPPRIPNPDYLYDPSIGQYIDNAYVGFEFFQYSAGTIIDNVLITDTFREAVDATEEIIRIHRNEKAYKEIYDKKLREQIDYLRSLEPDHEDFNKPVVINMDEFDVITFESLPDKESISGDNQVTHHDEL